MNTDNTNNTARLLKILGTLCERDESGRHFTETTDAEDLDDLEACGWIEIDRPRHGPTGIPYSEKYWGLRITDAGLAHFD
jgi:hypothetical protein